jgi:hypothetical protein
VRTVHPSGPAWHNLIHERPTASIDADATTTAAGGSVPDTRPARQNSLSAETLQTLEKHLSHRPDKQDLQDRNILKGALVPRAANPPCGSCA